MRGVAQVLQHPRERGPLQRRGCERADEPAGLDEVLLGGAAGLLDEGQGVRRGGLTGAVRPGPQRAVRRAQQQLGAGQSLGQRVVDLASQPFALRQPARLPLGPHQFGARRAELVDQPSPVLGLGLEALQPPHHGHHDAGPHHRTHDLAGGQRPLVPGEPGRREHGRAGDGGEPGPPVEHLQQQEEPRERQVDGVRGQGEQQHPGGQQHTQPGRGVDRRVRRSATASERVDAGHQQSRPDDRPQPTGPARRGDHHQRADHHEREEGRHEQVDPGAQQHRHRRRRPSHPRAAPAGRRATPAVVTLITLLVVLLSGLTSGLARGSTSAITGLAADHVAFRRSRGR